MCQNASIYIKSACKKERVDISQMPFRAEDCNLTPMHSTFLDIGSGFGKPNFHCALQVFPKESLGIEIVPARVMSSIDHMYNYEDKYNRQKKRDEERGKPEQPKDINGFPLPLTAETSNQNSFLLNDRRAAGLGNDEDSDSNNLSPVPTQRQIVLKNKQDLIILKEIDVSVTDLENKLRQINMIKGHANNIKKLQTDV